MDGFSAGLVDDDNIYEWEITIFGYVRLSGLRQRGVGDPGRGRGGRGGDETVMGWHTSWC